MKTQFIFNWFLLFTLVFNFIFILMTLLLIHWEFYALYFDLYPHQQPVQSWDLSLLPIESPHIHPLYPHLPTCPILRSLPTLNRVGQLLMGMGPALQCGWLTRDHTITESWLSLSQWLPKASSSSASAGLSCLLSYSLLGLGLRLCRCFVWRHNHGELIVVTP